MISDYDEGGLRAPNIDIMAKSLKLAWILRLLSEEENSEDSWKAIPDYLLDKFGGVNLLLRCNHDKKFLARINLVCVNLLKMKNKDFYKLLMNKGKGEHKMDSRFTTRSYPFRVVFGDMKSICNDNNLGEFYFKFLHRTIVTKKEPFLYGKESNMLCRYCQIIHTFQNCSWTKHFFLGSYKVVQCQKCHLSKLLAD